MNNYISNWLHNNDLVFIWLVGFEKETTSILMKKTWRAAVILDKVFVNLLFQVDICVILLCPHWQLLIISFFIIIVMIISLIF